MTRISFHLRHPARRRLRAGLAAAAFAVAATAATGALSTAAFAPQVGQRIDMKVLLLANSAADPDISAWEDNLKREGTPYDRINGATTTLTAAMLSDGERAKYQGVIVAGADGTLPSGRADAFSDAEWTLLRAFEKKFAIRQLNVNAVPGPPLGLGFATATGQLDGTPANLTPEGLAQFENLAGSVPFENLDPSVLETNGYGATPCAAGDATCGAASYQTLLRGSGGLFSNASLVGIATMKDDREEMNATFSANQFQVHSQVLRHAMLSWVTGGVFIGRDRSYLSMDVDDVFLPNDRWNATLNTTPATAGQPGQQDLRMTANDVQRLTDFQNQHNVKLNLLFNAQGVDDAGGPSEPLTSALLANKAQFAWVNHTFTHANLDLPSQSTIMSEIERNDQFAQANALPYDKAVLVTGEHSGIGTSSPVTAANPSMGLALNALGITSVGADNSREVGQRQVGNALTLPRYPMNVFYNVATWADQLDEYDWLYLAKTDPSGRGNCTNSASTTCFSAPVTQAQFIDREASAVVRHMLGNDPRPHYAHQANIMAGSAEPDVPVGSGVNHRGEGILYTVMGEALSRYRAYFKVAFDQPGMSALTQQLRRQIAWANTPASQVNGYIQDGKVTIVSTVSRDVPVTGTTVGDVNGGQRSGWLSVNGASTTLDLEEPRNTVAPVISGQSTVGSTLTATAGTFTGTPTPATTSRQWQRRAPGSGGAADGPWTSIPAATSATYVVTAQDDGRQLRFVTTAANSRATWGMGISAPVTVGAAGTATPPAPGGVPAAGAPTAGSAPSASVGPGSIAPPPDTARARTPVKRRIPPFTCSVKRAARLSLSCVVRNTSGGLRTARIRATRGRKVVGTASGRVRRGNRLPTLRIKRTARREDTRITITVRLANGKSRTMTRTLKL